MKYLKSSILFALAIILLASCEKDDDIMPRNVNEVEDLQLVRSFADSGYTVELFNKTGQLQVGYNKIYLRLTDANDNYVKEASIDWIPMMTMNMNEMTHQHTSPFSKITKVSGKQTLFEGYIVFVMASDEPENFWELQINFNADEKSFKASDKISVISSETEYNKTYTSAMGSDGKMYMLALVEPSAPKNGSNNFVVVLFKKGEDGNFPIVNNFKIKVDPRMPGMGNHSAPGNEDLTQSEDGFYHGKVGFSMPGYWKINLMLENGSGTVIKGEPISVENPESSLHFKIEF